MEFTIRTESCEASGEFIAPVHEHAASAEEAARQRIERLVDSPAYDTGRALVTDSSGHATLFAWVRAALVVRPG